MNSKKCLLIIFILVSVRSFSQWEVSLGAGKSFPITGYNEVVKPGTVIFNVEGNYSFKPEFTVGMRIQYARFSKDKNPDDAFYETKISVAPIIFTAEYVMNTAGNLNPYFSGGLGLSFFAVSYNSSPTVVDDHQINNISFTMMPAVGFRYKANDHLFPFLETGYMLLADGPPAGFPKSDKLTGYSFLNFGLRYKF